MPRRLFRHSTWAQRRPHASRRIVIFATGVATYGLSPKRSSFDEGIKAALNDREWLDDRDPKANKVRLRETLRREWCLECDPAEGGGSPWPLSAKAVADADIRGVAE
jgi:hypothetical protein